MAKKRFRAADLAKLLNASGYPIYVLDAQRTIVFANNACLEWLGCPGEELLGRCCPYHSKVDVSGVDALAAGLGPPPVAMAGEPSTGEIAHCDAQGRVRTRRARFFPLGQSVDEVVGLVVMAYPHDRPDGESELLTPDQEPTSDALHDAIRRFRAQAASRHRMDRLVGDSPAMRRVRAQVELAAGRRASVLVVGPTGSGRQHVATAIHYGGESGGRGSLVPLACSVLSAEMVQSTLHALSAAAADNSAAPGTLLLGDVDRLSGDAQSGLFSILTSRSFAPRVISTAARSLDELAHAGQYRADLAAALGTLVIELPSLCRRREDLPLLAQMLLEDINATGAKQLGGFTPEALDRLDAYPWPGNIDELARVVAEAHRHAEGPEITPGDLPKRIHLAADAAAHPRPMEEVIELDALLTRIETELIQRALTQAKGNKAKAARLLGLTRPRLYRRLVQLGLEPS